ncbi:MAG TPA: isoprenylcysteine carboxylmethyltransferase family protein, partial [Sphingopyxis sp.]|nr:isoprenylcysteine carboxylmethyltransferase family protein [Sphingopyxis sp.]
MTRIFYLAYAAVAYLIFLAVFLYLIAFVGNIAPAPVTVDRGPDAPLWTAVAVNVALIALFGFQHSVMARPAFKAGWEHIVPKAVERSTYVLIASLTLALLFVAWHPIPAPVWSVEYPAAAALLWTLFGLGWAIVLLSTFLLNHFELFGLQQVWFAWRDRAAAKAELRQPLFYRFVRHPLYAGFFLAFWATPQMSAGHLLLAA